MYIDTHCHLSKNNYDNIENIILSLGSNIIIISGTNPEDNKEVIELCNKYNNVYGTIGYHPSEVDTLEPSDFDFICDNINNPKIVGIGEIGLDYYHGKENINLQKEVFIKQLLIAKQYNKPVVIHSRNAAFDTYEILKESASDLKIDIHCFSYGIDMAKKFISLNAKLGIGGVLTFKNSIKLKEVVELIDLDNFILETDSPYLSPEPFRGMKNEPKNVYCVAQKIAEIKNISVDEVLQSTTKNAVEQFDLKI